MPENREDILFHEALLDTSQLKNALSTVEKAYAKFFDQIDKATDGLENQEDQHRKTGESANKQAKETINSGSKLINWFSGFFKKKKKLRDEDVKGTEESNKNRVKSTGFATRGIVGFIRHEKAALESLGLSWSNLISILGGGAILGAIFSSMKSFLEFDKQIRSVTVTLGDQPRVLAAATNAIQGLTGHLDVTREELVALTTQIGELKLIKGNTQEASAAFRSLVTDTINLSKSMDVSTDSVVGLYDQFTRVYGLPHNRLRNISASMKFIQETTSISGQELISFTQNLDGVLSRMINTSDTAKAEVTADMMAIAGVFKQAGVQPENIATLFTEALKVQSEQGNKFLGLITENTEFTIDQVRRMMEEGDVQTPAKLLIERLSKEGPEWLKHNENWLSEVTNLNFTQLKNISEMNSATLADMFIKNREEFKRGQRHADAAAKRQHELSKLWNNLKRVLEKIWLSIGKNVAIVVTKIADKLVPVLNDALSRMSKWSEWALSSKGGESINIWIDKAISFFKGLWEWVKRVHGFIVEKMFPVFEFLFNQIGNLVKWFQSLSGTEQQMLAWATVIGLAITKLGGTFSLVVAGLAGVFAGGMKLGQMIDEFLGRADKFRAIKESLRITKKQQAAVESEARFKGIRRRIQALQTTTAEGAIEELRRMMQEGVITAEGTINVRQADIARKGMGAAKGLQRLLETSLGRLAEVERVGEGREMTGAQILQEAIPTAVAPEAPETVPMAQKVKGAIKPPMTLAPISEPLKPKIQVTASSPREEKLLAEIRDGIFRLITQKRHPSRQVVESLL